MFNNLKIMKKRFNDTTVVMFRAYWFWVWSVALLGNTFYYRCASQNQLYTMSKYNLP